jgi:hypothetical protein
LQGLRLAGKLFFRINMAQEKIYGWQYTPLSLARFYGGCKFNGHEYWSDYFAAKAMQGMLSMETQPVRSRINTEPYIALAEEAYRMADAMMETRK